MLSWNWGYIMGCAGVVQSTLAAIRYFCVGDIRRGLYYTFAALIAITVVF